MLLGKSSRLTSLSPEGLTVGYPGGLTVVMWGLGLLEAESPLRWHKCSLYLLRDLSCFHPGPDSSHKEALSPTSLPVQSLPSGRKLCCVPQVLLSSAVLAHVLSASEEDLSVHPTPTTSASTGQWDPRNSNP